MGERRFGRRRPLGGRLRAVEASPTRLRRSFENPFQNAVAHGGETVDVTFGTVDDGAGFYVADDGPGVPSNDREAAFEPGYTAGDDDAGFGLSIVRRIADAHDWTVSVSESADGRARFEITNVDRTSADAHHVESTP